MSARLLSVSKKFIKSFQHLSVAHQHTISIQKCDLANRFLLESHLPALTSVRHTSFFNKLTADELWKGSTSVSNAGRKRGRAKGIARKKDLNRGQIIGVGRTNILWPGLNAPIIRGKELVKQKKLPDDPNWEGNLRKIRDNMSGFRVFKLNPLERGWSGAKMAGRSIGPPDAIGENTFEGFDTRVLEMKLVFIMKGNLGRTRRTSVFVVTGNKQGLAGFALTKSVDNKAAMRKAKNRAAQKLMSIEICNGHTVMHDFFCQFGLTKIYVTKMPEGYGLVCHRAIKTICECIGIKDLHAKIEGATNVQNVTKAFFLGLLQQRTHEQIAEEKGMHLVEIRSGNDNFPNIVASPTVCRKADEIPSNEILDFKQCMMDGKIVYKKKKFPPFYTKHRSWDLYCRRQELIRNHDKVKLGMFVDYGEVRSFLTEKYPECRPPVSKPKEVEDKEN